MIEEIGRLVDARRRYSGTAGGRFRKASRGTFGPALAGLVTIYRVTVDDGASIGVFQLDSMVSAAHLAGSESETMPCILKFRCFDRFSIPRLHAMIIKARIRAVAEELDAHRKARQAEHPGLTLTQMYNVLEKLKAGAALQPPKTSASRIRASFSS